VQKLILSWVVTLAIGVLLGCRTTTDGTQPVLAQQSFTPVQPPPGTSLQGAVPPGSDGTQAVVAQQSSTPAQPPPGTSLQGAPPQSARDRAPRFEGEIGQLEKATKFANFISSNAFKIVLLNVWMSEGEFDGDASKRSFFVLWETCPQPLGPGEKPNYLKCGGTEYNIAPNPQAAESGLFYSRGVYRLEGYFSVSGYGGPNQGLMGTTLKPLRVEDVH
jgi:hypothetical protein